MACRHAHSAERDGRVRRRLVCGDLQMFIGKMGRKAGSIAVRVSEKIEKGTST